MSSDLQRDAAIVPAPIAGDGEVLVYASAVSASAEIDLVATTDAEVTYYEFEADGVDVYLTFGPDGTVTDPSSTATSGGGRAVKVAAGTSKHLALSAKRGSFKHIASATGGYLRVYKSSRGVVSKIV